MILKYLQTLANMSFPGYDITMILNKNLAVARIGKTFVSFLAVILVLWSFSACTRNNQPPAPLGEKAVLEKLADAFKHEANRIAWSPQHQTPSAKRDFVENVFATAEYSYDATLAYLAANKLDPGNQLHRDLVELVLFPTVGISLEDIAKIYDHDEFKVIQKIRKETR